MSQPPSIAIVILNWNGMELLPRFLPSVLEHSHRKGVSVYVADNGSTDGSPDYVANRFPQVKLIRLERNHGFAGGYNKALAQIDAGIFVLLNSDVEVTPAWLDPCIRRFSENPALAAVQPKILSWADRSKFEYAGAAGVSSTGGVIPSAVGASSPQSKKTGDSTINRSPFSGPPVPACLSVPKPSGQQGDSMRTSLPTWRRSTSAGG